MVKKKYIKLQPNDCPYCIHYRPLIPCWFCEIDMEPSTFSDGIRCEKFTRREQ
jgi:hypothetical protein